jgi:hypothetical protein
MVLQKRLRQPNRLNLLSQQTQAMEMPGHDGHGESDCGRSQATGARLEHKTMLEELENKEKSTSETTLQDSDSEQEKESKTKQHNRHV